jgi:hypothetical protein
VRRLGLAFGGGILLQTAGCNVDPDLLLQAAIQFFTEFAIFATENAAIGLR